MKIVFYLISVFIFSSFAYSQDSKHMTFKGIPISGKILDFVSKMQDAGFVTEHIVDNAAIMSGIFVNKQCKIYIILTPKSKEVWKVSVVLPKINNWGDLKNEYYHFKEQFSLKYGEPSNSYEFFLTPYYEGDGFELQALRNKKCTYSSYWNINEGSIVVDINNENVCLTYEDKIGVDLFTGEDQENIQDDI